MNNTSFDTDRIDADGIVEASFSWTREEFVAAQLAYTRQLARPVLRWIFYGGLFVVWYLTFSSQGVTQKWLLVEALILSAFVLGRGFIWKWRAGKRWQREQHRMGSVYYVFSAESVALRTKTSNATLLWSAFSRIVEVGDGFLFFTQTVIFHWVPLHAFESTSDIEQVRDFIVRSEVPFVPLPNP